MSDCLQPHGLQHARLLCPSPTPELAQTKVHWVRDVILCHPLFLLPSLFPSIRIFSNESVLRIWWPEYWSFSFSISPSNELLGLISSRIDWFDLLAVQGTLKSLLQHHSSKAPVPQHSVFFMVPFSHPYMTMYRKPIFLCKITKFSLALIQTIWGLAWRHTFYIKYSSVSFSKKALHYLWSIVLLALKASPLPIPHSKKKFSTVSEIIPGTIVQNVTYGNGLDVPLKDVELLMWWLNTADTPLTPTNKDTKFKPSRGGLFCRSLIGSF